MGLAWKSENLVSGKDSLKGRRGNLFDCGKVLLEGVQAHLDDEVVQSEKILGDDD